MSSEPISRPSPSPSSSTLPADDDHKPNPSLPSLISHFAYPVSYTVSGLLRRISADEAPTALARALSANYNGSLQTPATSSAPPPKRRTSPFRPPPLTPLTLTGRARRRSSASSGAAAGALLLDRDLAEEIRLLVPPRLQLVDRWRLAYSLERDGTSLGSLFGRCAEHKGKRGGFVLAVRDGAGAVFGAYLSDPPRPAPHYYGTGECFLWRVSRAALRDEEAILSSLPPPPSEDTTNLGRMTTLASPTREGFEAALLDFEEDDEEFGEMESAPLPPVVAARRQSEAAVVEEEEGSLRFKAFPYTGDNDFTILCGAGYLSVGGGDGRYGLWLDDRMARGVSDTCPTFANEPLSGAGTKFDVLGVEVWYVGA